MLTQAEREEMFNNNKDIVPYFLRGKWYTKFLEWEDLMQEGNMVLWKCTGSYDRTLGVAFSTYVCSQLTYHMNNYANVFRLGGRYSSAHEHAISAAHYAYTENKSIVDVCNERNLSKGTRDVAYLISRGHKAFVSLYTPIGNDSDSEDRQLYEIIPSEENLEEEVCSALYNENIMDKVFNEFVEYYESLHVSKNKEQNRNLLIVFLNNIFFDRVTINEAAKMCNCTPDVARVRFEKFRKCLREWVVKSNIMDRCLST